MLGDCQLTNLEKHTHPVKHFIKTKIDAKVTMSGEGKGKKRSKAFYRKSAHGSKCQKTDDYKLIPGIRGFLVTCNHNESGALRESYNILNDYADRIYGQGKSQLNPSECPDVPVASGSDDSDDDDIEKAMKKEIDGLKTVPSQERRFQKCQSKAKNLLFIRSTVDDPVKVCQLVMEDIAENRLQRARYAARILPVVGTCKAHTPDIEKLAQTCLKDIFSRDNSNLPESYTVMFRVRNNNATTCGKTSVVSAIIQVVKDINPYVTFSWADFDVAVLVEVVCTICCLCVAPSFTHLRKYNLQELQQGPKIAGTTEKDFSVTPSMETEDDNGKADLENVDTSEEPIQKDFVNDFEGKQTESENQKLNPTDGEDIQNKDTEMDILDKVDTKDHIGSEKNNTSEHTDNNSIVLKAEQVQNDCLSQSDCSENIKCESLCNDNDENSVSNGKFGDSVLKSEEHTEPVASDNVVN